MTPDGSAVVHGLSYMAYTEQITFLLFLQMADEMTRPPFNRPPIVPAKFACQGEPSRTVKPFSLAQVIAHRITSRGQLKRTGNVSPAPRLTSSTAPHSAKRRPCHR